MKLASSKLTTSAATLFAFGLIAMAAPSAHADYCITNGAQAAHGCGYQTIESCRAATAGIGGVCALNGSSNSGSNDAMAYHPAQPRAHRRAHQHLNLPAQGPS
jgi:hypothetical protein